jgi:hypothetical protein
MYTKKIIFLIFSSLGQCMKKIMIVKEKKSPIEMY